MHTIAIVTGASSGIGREFVRLLDNGSGGPLDEIWLIARHQDKLAELASGLATPTRVLPLDLADPASYQAFADALAEVKDLQVQWLINSAGFGAFGNFEEIPEVRNANMVRLNCLAVVEMCYHALAYMRPGSRIINLASAAALLPQPGLSVYGATKSFVLSFSRALDFELKGTGIHVSAVCPKFMHTSFLDDPGDKDAVSDFTWIGFEDASACASQALRGAIKGKATIITSPDVRLFNFVCKLGPVDCMMHFEHFMGQLLGGKK